MGGILFVFIYRFASLLGSALARSLLGNNDETVQYSTRKTFQLCIQCFRSKITATILYSRRHIRQAVEKFIYCSYKSSFLFPGNLSHMLIYLFPLKQTKWLTAVNRLSTVLTVLYSVILFKSTVNGI